MRISKTAMTTATLFLITLSIIVPLISAADIVDAGPVRTIPVNDTSLYAVATHGPSAPLSSFEKQEEITLFRIELNQTTFPGPRSMAFGPRYIQLTGSPATLIILVTGVFVGGIALFIMHIQKKAGKTESFSKKEEAKGEHKKQE